MKKLFQLGVSENHPEYLNKKIKISNKAALILVFFALIFSIQFMLKRPNLVFLPVGALVNFIMIFILNALGAVTLSRFLMAVGPMVLINSIHAFIVPAGEVPAAQTFALGMSVLALPFILFDYKERAILLTTVVLLCLQLLFLPQLINFFEIELSSPFVFTTGNYMKDVLIALIVMSGTLYMMIKNNHTFEKEVQNANQEKDKQYQDMVEARKSLEDTLSQVEKSQEEERKRGWATNGLSELNQLLRGVDDLSQAYDQVISWIVNYIEANQGSLFVLEEEGDHKYLELKACYAYSRKKFLEKRIEIGEGMVGQCYLEEEYTYLTEIPQNYIRITSGLGEATPDAVLIMPLIVNEKVEGVIELASFGTFEQHVIEFLQKAGESIAATIARHRVNIRTVRLLQESQENAQQMKEQEEEMRQNLEEFEALQEEMKRKESHYQQEIAELREELKSLKAEVR